MDTADDAHPRPELVPNAAVRSIGEAPRPRRDLVDDFAEDADTEAFLRASGRNRRIRRGLIPSTRNGRIAAGVGVFLCLGAMAAGCLATMRYMTTSDKFRIMSSQNIEVDGNSHLSRAQMLSVFGEDVDGNIFHVPMEQRRAQLEQMPWVEHATVMRLLPNRLRVQVTERVPVAFVRQGSTLGMVDANGVLLDIPPDAPGNPSYSFPVITGIKAQDDAAGRAQRMKLYASFLKDLDSDGKGTSSLLSEVDLSDPEDVRALIPDHNNEVLVHFGTENFLGRYKKFEDHIAEWRSQYARLSSVDMRYERQVVLQMPPKDSTVGGTNPAVDASAPKPEVAANLTAAKPAILKPAVLKPTAIALAKPVSVPVKSAPVKLAAPVAKPVATTAVVIPPVSTHPAVPAVKKAVAVAKPAHSVSAKSEAKDAATRKRVDAIKAWMAKRQKMRATAAHTASN